MSPAVDVLRAARDRGAAAGRIALIGVDPVSREARAFTGRDLEAAVKQRSEALANAGARSGRVHPTALEPDADGVIELLALWRLGAVPAPLNVQLTAHERAEAEQTLSGRDLDDGQVVLWTSGTTGRPRGVVLGYDLMEAHVDAVVARLALDGERDTWLASLSPAHVGGLMLVFRAALTGSALVACGPFDPAGTASLLDGSAAALAPSGARVTHMSLVPTQLLRVLDATEGERPPSTFRCLLLGGAHAPAALIQRARGAGWPVALTYGMTEMASQVATAPPDEVARDPSTVGRPLDGVEVRVADDGELWVRTVGRPARDLEGEFLSDEDGWYRTGDVGEIDPEGRVRVTGRRSDRIVSGGVTVDALEVEEAVRRHPAVVDVCVAGVADPEWGELVGACVIPVEGEFDLTELELWLRDRLSDAKRPRRWTFKTQLPLNPNGKVDRAAVRRLLEAPPE